MRRRLGTLIVALAAFTVAVAHAAPAGTKKAKPAPTVSKSVGAPNKGHLEGGARVDPGPHLKVLGTYAKDDVVWGVKELVSAIDHAAKEVRKRYPDAVLGVGHLSQKGGGSIDRHASHESGRDADLAFYLSDVAGQPIWKDRFLTIRPDGIAASDSHARFDEGRNWALVSALATDPKARVTHIFVANHLRTRLLAYGARVGAKASVRARVAEVLMQPTHALPHDDHFHVRVACPPGSPACIEWPIAKSKAVAKKPAAGAASGATLAKSKPASKPKPPKTPTKKLVRARSKIGPDAAPGLAPKLAPPLAPPPDREADPKAAPELASDDAVVTPIPTASEKPEAPGSGA